MYGKVESKNGKYREMWFMYWERIERSKERKRNSEVKTGNKIYQEKRLTGKGREDSEVRIRVYKQRFRFREWTEKGRRMGGATVRRQGEKAMEEE